MYAHAGSPIEALKEEHRAIERMLRILNTASEKMERDEEVPLEIFKKAVDFVRAFADRCHHGKEEETLFPVIEQRGVPRGGPTDAMRFEHERGRKFVKALAKAVEKTEEGYKSTKPAIIENVRGYTQLLSQHIFKEDNVLYPLAEKVLKPSDLEELLERFETIETERIGEGKHQEYIKLIEELENQLKT